MSEFYLKGREIFKRPCKSPTGVSMGFRVCEVDKWVDSPEEILMALQWAEVGPELLESCEDIMKYVYIGVKEVGIFRGEPNRDPSTFEAVVRISDAIAKAREIGK